VPPGTWSWNPEALVGVGLAVAYLLALRRWRAGRWRIASFLGGCALIAVVFVTPWDTVAVEYLLWLHLLQNVVLAEWAPLLLVLGIPPALAARLAAIGAVRVVTHPLVALPVWVGAYAAWHVPLFYDAALRHGGMLLALEHLTYLVTGLALWWCVWQDEPHRLATGARAAYVFAGFVLSAPLGLVLALVPKPIYDAYADAPERLWGIGRQADQELGGITMATEQAVVFFCVFAIWFLRFLAEQEELESPARAP
jgi:cytochrome c oxidase assembly factor CtaG